MTRVRTFTADDIPRVADLFLRVFGKGAPVSLSHPQVARSLADVFLNHPWRKEPLASFVCEASAGAVVGFLGVTPRRMRFRGRSLLVAVSAHLMVDPDAPSSLAGVQLQRALFAGPQDLSITDGATDQGLAIWTGLGGSVAAVPSLTWMRPLRPAALAAAAVRSRYPILSSAMTVAGPGASLVDRVLTRRGPRRFRCERPDTAEAPLDARSMLAAIADLPEGDRPKPDVDAAAAEWVMARASSFVSPGALHQAVVKDGRGVTLGWYVYHLNPRGVSDVLQVVSTGHSLAKVFDHLCYDAWSRGALGLRGRADASLVEVLGLRDCSLICGNPWVLAQAKDPELLDSVCQGRAWFTRLDGEWCTSVRA